METHHGVVVEDCGHVQFGDGGDEGGMEGGNVGRYVEWHLGLGVRGGFGRRLGHGCLMTGCGWLKGRGDLGEQRGRMDRKTIFLKFANHTYLYSVNGIVKASACSA